MNTTENSTIAPLTNVALTVAALERSINRPIHLPGMVVLNGPSGWGKTSAATYTANKFQAYYVEARSGWTRKALLLSILNEMGIEAAKTLYEMTDQISEQLAKSNRPLIVDEIDHIIEKKAIETIRDIYEGSAAAILLIGEERVPTKLKQWERFHGRILDWVQAQPPSFADARQLRKLYCLDVDIKDDLLKHIHKESKSSVRRIAVNLARVEDDAKANGMKSIDMKQWGDKPLFTGDAPARRIS